MMVGADFAENRESYHRAGSARLVSQKNRPEHSAGCTPASRAVYKAIVAHSWFINIDAQDAQDFLGIRPASYAGNSQNSTGSSPELASRAGSSHPVNPVHPVHR
ncbi:MAG: hypothetical protein OXI92_13325, partial [Acidobacteriota bacterium]|nr:hypothetical protein [Acidobacteriota bacterium]